MIQVYTTAALAHQSFESGFGPEWFAEVRPAGVCFAAELFKFVKTESLDIEKGYLIQKQSGTIRHLDSEAVIIWRDDLKP